MKNVKYLKLIGMLVYFSSISIFLFAQWEDTAHVYSGWRVLLTDHTEIIYETHDFSEAEEIASYADEIFQTVSELFGYHPKERVPVVLTGRTALANGFYSPFPHRITLFITSPSDRFLGSRSESWLRSLYIHELVHYIHLTAPHGPAKVSRYLLGPDSTVVNYPFMPLWWIEGIAVYAETALSNGGRGDSAIFQARYRAFVLEQELWHRNQMRYWSPFEPRDRPYMGGYLFVNYLIERFGSEIFVEINRSFARFPFFDLAHAIRRVTGSSFQALYNDMRMDLHEDFSDFDISTEHGFNVFSLEQGHRYLPFRAADKWLVYEQTQSQAASLVLYNDDFIELQRFSIGRLTDPLSLSVSHDGQSAVFALSSTQVHHNGAIPAAAQGYSDLYQLHLPSGEIQQLSSFQQLYQPTVNHDAGIIAALTRTGSFYQLVEVCLDEKTVRSVYAPSNASLYEPQLSADGQYAIAVENRSGLSALLRINLEDGTAETLIPHSRAAIYRPRISLDGRILFSSDIDGSLSLYAYDDGSIYRIMDDPVGVIGGTLHADELLYGVYRYTGYTVRKVSLLDFYAEEVQWLHSPKPVVPASSRNLSTVQADSVPYLDFPRAGLWYPLLPFALTDEAWLFNPGLGFVLNSPLGKNAVTGSMSYLPDSQNLSFFLNYSRFQSWGNVGITLSSDYDPNYALRMHRIGFSTQYHLWQHRKLNWQYGLSINNSVSYLLYIQNNSIPVLENFSMLRYWQIQESPAAAIFGSDQIDIRAAALVIQEEPFSDNSATLILPQFYLSAQKGLFWQHAFRLDFDVLAISQGSAAAYLLPKGDALWYQDIDAVAKLRHSLYYRVPVALFDWWIPAGGMTAFGVSGFLQSAWYLTDTENWQFLWEQALFTGLEFSLNWQFLAVELQSSAGISVRIPFTETFSPHPKEDLRFYASIGL